MISLLLMILASEIGSNQVYDYVNYSLFGESHNISFDIKNKRIISHSNYSSAIFSDCSTKAYKCLEINNEVFYVPRKNKISGEYSSPYGKYIIYDNDNSLPFNSKIEYKVIKLIRNPGNGEDEVTFFYNPEKGIIALLDSILKDKESSRITWLSSNCGLLASQHCKNE